MTNLAKKQNTPVNDMKNLLASRGMQNMFENALKDKAGPFIASIIDLYSDENSLQECSPKDVAMEALKAATLNLPINKSLGFAYIVQFKNKKGTATPTFIIGYKGYIQLAMRTGQYKALNSGILYEGMEIKNDYLSGTIEITGEPKSDKVLGYFAYFKLINGFEKAIYMSKEEVIKYGKKYSRSYSSSYSPWQTEFDEMAKKTVMRKLLSKYGVLSTEMQNMISAEEDKEVLAVVENNNAITEPDYVVVDEETGEIIEDDSQDEVKAPF